MRQESSSMSQAYGSGGNVQGSMNQQSSCGLPFGPKTLVFGATALIAYGLTRRSKAGTAVAAAGGIMAWQAMRSNSAEPSETHATFLVNTTPDRAYFMWRDFQNLPRFMAQLKEVRVLDSRRSEWTALGPMDKEVRWTAEITDDSPNERIAWRSLPDSDVETSGYVSFRPDPQGRGTFITAEMLYRLPGGAVTTALATAAGKHPEFLIRENLRRFKSLLETGEVPTTAGQTHGERGMHGHTSQVLLRETSNHPAPQAEFARTA